MMKLLLITIALQFSTASLAQDSSNYRNSGIILKDSITRSCPIVIQTASGKALYMDFGGDTLKAWGTLTPDSAAQIFLDELVEKYSKRIQDLRSEIWRLGQWDSGEGK